MPNIKSILQQAKGRTGSGNSDLSEKSMALMTKRVAFFNKELQKAYSTQNARKIQAVYKAMAQTQEINKSVNRINDLKKAIDKVNKSTLNAAQKIKEINKLSSEIVDLEDNVKDLSEALQEASRTPFEKVMNKVGNSLKSKTAQFIAAGTAAGFFTNALRNIDKSSVYVAESIRQMPLAESAREFREVGKSTRDTTVAVDGTVDSIENFGSAIAESIRLKGQFNDRIVKATNLQNRLRGMVLDTGKSLEELDETARHVMGTFRLGLDQTDTIVNTTLAAENLGSVLGVGTAEALEIMRKRSQDMGTSLLDSQLEMAGLAGNADTLRNTVEGLTMSNKQYTDLVYKTVDADVRASQNIRIKNQLMSNSIALLMKQGKTQKEAMQIAEDMVDSAVKGSETIEAMAGMDLAEQYAQAFKGGAEGQAAFISKMTQGMSGDEAAKATAKLKAQFERTKAAGGRVDRYSMGKILDEQFGSQTAGIEARVNAQSKIYGNLIDNSPDTAAEVMVKNGEFKTRDAALLRIDAIRKMRRGEMTAGQIAQGELTQNAMPEAAVAASKEEQQLKDVNDAARNIAAQGSMVDRVINAGKELINNPMISAALGVASTAGLIASIAANVMALNANTVALGGKGIGGGLLSKGGGLIKGAGGLITRAGTAVAGGFGTAGVLGSTAAVGAAGLAGYGVGTGINMAADKWGSSKNRYGQSSNFFEKGIGKMMLSKEAYDEQYGDGNKPAAAVMPEAKAKVAMDNSPATAVMPGSTSGAGPGGSSAITSSYASTDANGDVWLKIQGADKMVMQSMVNAKK